MTRRKNILFASLLLLTALTAFANIAVGSVSIPLNEISRILTGGVASRPSWHFIILESRLPQIATAALAGAALSVSGLMLQTAFRNPLAGPSVFGINSGAGLGVAACMLLMGGSVSVGTADITGFMAILSAAFVGALAVMIVICAFAAVVRSSTMLLIIGIMIGYMADSAISLLNFFATDEGVKSYMVWGMGSFSGVSSDILPVFALLTISGILAAALLMKPLDALMLGERYAASLGVNIRRTRNLLLLTTSLLAAVVTAFCGPIAFIGLAVPHVTRLIFTTDSHRVLLPATAICGTLVTLVCNLACVLPGENGVIPINAITPLVGAPVILYVILTKQ